MDRLLRKLETIRYKYLLRMDADEDDDQNSVSSGKNKKGTALSTSLPYGIARDLGINTEGMTPREVWDVIQGQGIDPKSTMEKKIKNPGQKVTLSSKEPSKKLEKISTDSFPGNLTGTTINKKQTALFCDHVNSASGSDSDAGKLYRGMKKLQEKCQISAVKNASRKHVADGKSRVVTTYNPFTGTMVSCEVRIPKITDKKSAMTTAHELAHYMDSLCGDGTMKGYMGSIKNPDLIGAVTSEKITGKDGVSKDTWDVLSSASKRAQEANKKATDELNKTLQKLNYDYLSHKMSYDEYDKQFKKAKQDGLAKLRIDEQEQLDGCDLLMDMYDAMSGGKFFGNEFNYGHGKAYYSGKGTAEKELFANYCTLSIFRPELLKHFEKDFPKTSAALKKQVEQMLKRMG